MTKEQMAKAPCCRQGLLSRCSEILPALLSRGWRTSEIRGEQGLETGRNFPGTPRLPTHVNGQSSQDLGCGAEGGSNHFWLHLAKKGGGGSQGVSSSSMEEEEKGQQCPQRRMSSMVGSPLGDTEKRERTEEGEGEGWGAMQLLIGPQTAH